MTYMAQLIIFICSKLYNIARRYSVYSLIQYIYGSKHGRNIALTRFRPRRFLWLNWFCIIAKVIGAWGDMNNSTALFKIYQWPPIAKMQCITEKILYSVTYQIIYINNDTKADPFNMKYRHDFIIYIEFNFLRVVWLILNNIHNGDEFMPFTFIHEYCCRRRLCCSISRRNR